MVASRSFWQRLRLRLLTGLAAPALLFSFTPEFSQAKDWIAPPVERTAASEQPAPAPQVVTMDLSTARRLALEKQPAVAAARSSYMVAIARHQALVNLRVPGFLARDLPTRRKQACLGVAISQADVQRAEGDAVYSATFGYLSVLYAREQDQLTVDVITTLKKLADAVDKGKKAGQPFYVAGDEDRVETYSLIARSRQQEARVGQQKAVSVLLEAIGLLNCTELALAQATMPRLQPAVDCKEIVCQALARRPEMLQVRLAEQVTSLEIDAQRSVWFRPRVTTFAHGSDLHSRPLPPGYYGSDYRPAVVEPEMPASINGQKRDRVEQAEIYTARAGSVVEKARNLIALESEQACLRYQEAVKRMAYLEPALEKAKKVFDDMEKRFGKGRLPSVREVIEAGSLVTELRSQINQMRYQALVSLASLERVTAGGFVAGFEPPATPAKLP